MKRHNGRIDLYWVADEDLVKKGYQPKTIRILGLDWNLETDRVEIAARCRHYQAEMLEWASGGDTPANPHGHGTIAWVCTAFETDEDSPYHEKRPDTQRFYSQWIKSIVKTVGQRPIASVIGRDIRRWRVQWQEMHGERAARACIQTLRRCIKYGAGDLGNPACKTLAAMLEEMEFPITKGRKVRATYDLVQAFRPKAHESGRASIALAVTLQFDLGLRQKDVIGEWVRAGDGSREGIMDGEWRWQWGLTWDQIDQNWILKKPTSKSNGNEIAEHDLKLYPDTMAELSKVPSHRRIGPVLIDEGSGKPYRARHFRDLFRRIADDAGWPKGVWNMDSRAGSVSEAFEAGADPADVMKHATHRQISTTMGYNRGAVVQSARVAELRVAKRQKKEKGE
ncbi:integrase [Microvirga sp. KLBC 81]|nr:integrase [Microvirga sp. KLBC 81]